LTVSSCSKMRVFNWCQGQGLMFCPRCAQQATTDVRFCSRCGMPLNVIAQITANDGVATSDAGYLPSRTQLSRPKGVRIGTILILASMVIAPIFFGLAVHFDGPAPLVAPLTLFLTGLSMVLYARAFGDPDPIITNAPQYQIAPPANRPMLPLPERPSIDGFASRRVNTSDMAEPPSVTDHTTQFFD
jgi:hypothetical protein